MNEYQYMVTVKAKTQDEADLIINECIEHDKDHEVIHRIWYEKAHKVDARPH